jgi:hypothetical protein
MAQFLTSQGTSVDHIHHQTELSAADIASLRAIVAGHASAQEVDAPTLRFNCHGFGYARSHAYFYSSVVPIFDADDMVSVPFDSPRRGDIVSYRKGGRLKHSGVVERVSDGQITRVRSKWGAMATVIHDPEDVPDAYGTPRALHRRVT